MNTVCHFCGDDTPGHVGGSFHFGTREYQANWHNRDWHKVLVERRNEGGFHWRNDIFFKRLDDGSVRIRYATEFNGCPNTNDWVIPSNEWETIIQQTNSCEQLQAKLTLSEQATRAAEARVRELEGK